MYLVNTNIIIGILRNKEEFINKYKIISEKSQPIYLTTYSLSEIHVGFYNQDFKKNYPKKLKLQEELFNKMVKKLELQNRILSLSIDDARILGNLFHLLRVNGKPIPIIDALNGAIAISRNITVITSDKAHFSVIKEINKQFKVIYW
jgi:predicted nucleic acid-binding protein